MTAREAALAALLRGGDAAVGLDEALRAAHLDARDRALATELAYGTLKMRRALEWSVSRCVDRPLQSLEPALRWVLLLGAYQLLYASRIPAHSAVDESVHLARARGHAGTAGLANAVLRRVARELPKPPRPGIPLSATPAAIAAFAEYASLPDWIAAALAGRFGDRALEIADGINAAPSRALWVNRRAIAPDALAERLSAAGASIHPARYELEDALGLGDVSAARGALDAALRDGLAQFQSEESMLAVALLAPAAGERILDVCAGRGAKTAAIVASVGPSGAVVSIDSDARKLDVLRAAMRRFGLTEPATIAADARVPLPAEIGAVDAAIIDAPCSALGLLGRRPDVRWRKRPTDPSRHAPLQRELLANVSQRVVRGGRMLYAVCSWHPDETDALIESFVESAGGAWQNAKDRLIPPGIGGADGFYYALLTSRAGTRR